MTTSKVGFKASDGKWDDESFWDEILGESEIDKEWDESKVRRGKSTPKSTPGSFAHKGLIQRMEQALRRDGGFTLDARTEDKVTDGYSVGVFPERSASFPLDGLTPEALETWLAANRSLLRDKRLKVGGWVDEETRKVWLDVVRIYADDDKDLALRVGRKKNQIAIANLRAISRGDWEHAIINTGGTGVAKQRYRQRFVLFDGDVSAESLYQALIEEHSVEKEWDESEHPRGKTSEESTPGSFTDKPEGKKKDKKNKRISPAERRSAMSPDKRKVYDRAVAAGEKARRIQEFRTGQTALRDRLKTVGMTLADFRALSADDRNRILNQIGKEWVEEDHPRGKTSEASTSGSFASKPDDGEDKKEEYRPAWALQPGEAEELMKKYNTQELRDAIEASKGQPETHEINTPEREALRDEIVDKLYGDGAAQKDRQLWIVVGGPGSGKNSAVADALGEENGALLVDADEAKKLLPEYNGGSNAMGVHVESSNITERVLAKAIREGDNIILPKVGKTYEDMAELLRVASASGYSVHYTLVRVPVRESVRRMFLRYKSTGRLISMDYAINKVGDRPFEVYNRLRNNAEIRKYVRSFEVWDNSDAVTQFGKKPPIRRERFLVRSGKLFSKPLRSDLSGVSTGVDKGIGAFIRKLLSRKPADSSESWTSGTVPNQYGTEYLIEAGTRVGEFGVIVDDIRKSARITSLRSITRGGGHLALSHLAGVADRLGYTLTAVPWPHPAGHTEGIRMMPMMLRKWFRNHGFENDAEEVMIRPPASPSPSATLLYVADRYRSDAAEPLFKSGEDQMLVTGWASVITDETGSLVVDRQGDIITEAELTKAAFDFMSEHRVAGEMHAKIEGVGDVVESVVVTDSLKKALGLPDSMPTGWLITVKVKDPEVWGKIKSGEYSAFSIGGEAVRTPYLL